MIEGSPICPYCGSNNELKQLFYSSYYECQKCSNQKESYSIPLDHRRLGGKKFIEGQDYPFYMIPIGSTISITCPINQLTKEEYLGHQWRKLSETILQNEVRLEHTYEFQGTQMRQKMYILKLPKWHKD